MGVMGGEHPGVEEGEGEKPPPKVRGVTACDDLEASSCCTVDWNKQEKRRKYWATRLSVRSFARTAHSFAGSGLLASLAPSAALTHSLARSLFSLPRSWGSELLMSQNDLVMLGNSYRDY